MFIVSKETVGQKVVINQFLALYAVQNHSSLGIYASILHTNLRRWLITQNYSQFLFPGIQWVKTHTHTHTHTYMYIHFAQVYLLPCAGKPPLIKNSCLQFTLKPLHPLQLLYICVYSYMKAQKFYNNHKAYIGKSHRVPPQACTLYVCLFTHMHTFYTQRF